ncbi:hypothetical protein ACQ4PT_046556 [Festuca glaucescens]
MASGTGKAMGSSWTSAMRSSCAGTVEVLKDRHAGVCRWSHAFRYAQQRGSTTAAAGNSKSKAMPAAGGAAARRKARQEQEEELRTVMYLSIWGPNN